MSKLEPVEVQDHALPGRIGGRGVLLAKFGDGADGLAVAVAHLSLGAGSRMSQLIAFNARCPKRWPSALNAGAVPEDPAAAPGCIVPTFPSWRPDRAIDHILVSSGLQTRTVEAVPAAFSDHLALAMQIDVPADALR